VAIEGIGGLGKTSLADALLRQLIGREQFEEVGWVSARQQIFNLSGQIEQVNRPPALRTGALVERLLTQLLPDEASSGGMSPEDARRLLTQRLRGGAPPGGDR
jgi:CO dehydrogenase nickel-insertion accessory protein CooC1